MGGDEFLIIFPCYNGYDAKEVIESICNKLEVCNKNGEKPFKYSFSYRIIEITRDSKVSANEVIKATDQKMYYNKLSKKTERK